MTPSLASKWIKLTGYGLIVFALLQFSRASPVMNAPGDLLADMFKWPIDGDPGIASQEAKLMIAVTAGLTVSVGVLFARLLSPLIAEGDVRAKSAGIWALLGWYILDTLGSLASGIPQNIFFGTLFLVVLITPFLLVRFNRP